MKSQVNQKIAQEKNGAFLELDDTVMVINRVEENSRAKILLNLHPISKFPLDYSS